MLTKDLLINKYHFSWREYEDNEKNNHSGMFEKRYISNTERYAIFIYYSEYSSDGINQKWTLEINNIDSGCCYEAKHKPNISISDFEKALEICEINLNANKPQNLDFKKMVELPLNWVVNDDNKNAIKATIARTLRLSFQYTEQAKEYYKNLPKATLDNDTI